MGIVGVPPVEQSTRQIKVMAGEMIQAASCSIARERMDETG
jgi:hypothetical protein